MAAAAALVAFLAARTFAVGHAVLRLPARAPLSLGDSSNVSYEEPPNLRRVVWVVGYPRSSTSTVLSMVSSGSVGFSHHSGKPTFSLFEPCHGDDEYTEEVKHLGCRNVIRKVTRCNFTGVLKLWGLADPHSTHLPNGSALTPTGSSSFCNEAGLVAFKTVDNGHQLKNWEWLLTETPKMRVVNVIRDPRGIYASWKTMEPFATLLKQHDYYTLRQVCENFVANLDFNHSRVHNLVYEDLISNPRQAMFQAYKFLGLPFGKKQLAWINSTFDATDCPEPKPWEIGYTDCHTDSKDVVEKWRTVLTKAEIRDFNDSPACQRVVKHFGYPVS